MFSRSTGSKRSLLQPVARLPFGLPLVLPVVGLVVGLGSGCSGVRGKTLEPNWSSLKEESQGSHELNSALGKEDPEVQDEGSRAGLSGRSGLGENGEMVVLGVKLQNKDFDLILLI